MGWHRPASFPPKPRPKSSLLLATSEESTLERSYGRGGRGPDKFPWCCGTRSSAGTNADASRVAGSRSGQGHHLHYWAQGGPTALLNLAPLCRRHPARYTRRATRSIDSPTARLRFRRAKFVPGAPRLSKPWPTSTERCRTRKGRDGSWTPAVWVDGCRRGTRGRDPGHLNLARSESRAAEKRCLWEKGGPVTACRLRSRT
jgi:hypothetical protein